MAGSFVAFRKDQNDPRHGSEGLAWHTALGGAQDAEMALLRVAALARLPTYCPDDGLDLLGQAYALPRYPSEANAAYRARLAAAFPTWAKAGTVQAIIDQLVAFGIPDVHVFVEAGNKPIYAGVWPSRFRVTLGPNFGTTGIGPSQLGMSLTLNQSLLGSTMTVAQRAAIKSLIWFWKAAHGVTCDFLLVYDRAVLGAATFTGGVGTVLGQFVLSGNVGDSAEATILPQFGSNTYLGSFVLNQPDLT